MTEGENPKPYDLEERTFQFAKRVRAFVKLMPRVDANVIDGRQVVRSPGSVGANYIEANEALSRKDFVVRIKSDVPASNPSLAQRKPRRKKAPYRRAPVRGFLRPELPF